jgi:hypothetical protein
MNVTLLRRPGPAPLIWLPAGLPCDYHRRKHCGHASIAPRTPSTDGEDVNGSHHGATSNSDLGLRLRLARLKSP